MGIGNIANTGMRAAMTEMEVISNNISNANTIGFKSSSANFADIYPSSSGGGNSQAGLGVNLVSIQQNFKSGGSENTGNPFDLQLKNPNGFFVLKDGNSGQVSYTRAGHFTPDKDGYLTAGGGATRLQGYLATAGVVGSGASVGDLQISRAPRNATATSTVEFNLNLDPNSDIPGVAFDSSDVTTYNYKSSETAIDSLGNEHTVDVYFINAGSNDWDTEIEVDGTNIGSGTVSFNSNGVLTGTTGMTALSFAPGTGATTPQSFDIALSTGNGSTTQFSGSFETRDHTNDGYGIGNFIGVQIDSDGYVTSIYSNKEQAVIGKIAVAEFASPSGLSNIGNMSWVETGDSGSAQMNVDNSDGSIASEQLELSNVDLTQEMINLIGAQHNFQANAQVEQAFNEVMQTIIKI
jgi:flagellar hook protein FlgE